MGITDDGGRLVLSIADEENYFSPVSSIDELLQDDASPRKLAVHRSGYLLDRSESAKFIGAAGGPCIPDWWRNDDAPFFGEFCFYRISSVFYLPKLGLLIDSTGSLLKKTFGECSYLYPRLEVLPFVVCEGSEVAFYPGKVSSTFDHAVISFPWGANSNYGHFVLDCLPTIAVTDDHPGFDGWNLLFPPLKDWHREHLGLVGVRNPIELADDVVYIEHAMYASPIDHFLHAPSIALHELAAKQIAALPDARLRSFDRRSSKKIYLSRRGDTKRSCATEADLERSLSLKGFQIIHPELMTISDQIETFMQAAIIVGLTGAAFANVIYCREGTTIVEIQPTTLNGIWVRNASLLTECVWLPYFCEGRPSEVPVYIDGNLQRSIGTEIVLDVDDFMNFLRHSRLIS